MAAKNQHDYDLVKQQLIDALRNGTPANWADLAAAIKIGASTLRSASKREWSITDPKELLGHAMAENIPLKLGLSVEEGENTREVNYTTTGMVESLDGAIKRSKTNLSIWQVRDHLINFWAVPMKIKDGDGKESPIVVQVCQVKIWLVRKKLKAIMPMIQPIEVPQTAKPVKPTNGKQTLRRALIIADVHMGFRRPIHSKELIPFHDRRVLDIVLQILQSTEYDLVAFIGDVMDLAEWSSKFTPEPEFYFTTQPALLEWAWWLSQFRSAAPRAAIDQYEGNHDKRMGDMIVGYMRAAYGLRPVDEIELPPSMSVDRLLALHRLNVRYLRGYPDNFTWLNSNVMLTHGNVVRAGPGDTAKAVINKSTYTTIFAHVHRTELVSRRIQTRQGDVIQRAFCPGCACLVDGKVPGSTKDQQWQQGIAEVEYTDDFERIIPIPITEGRAIHNGRIYEARDRNKEVEEDLFSKLEKIDDRKRNG